MHVVHPQDISIIPLPRGDYWRWAMSILNDSLNDK